MVTRPLGPLGFDESDMGNPPENVIYLYWKVMATKYSPG
jgi:hypothetical protein